MNWLKARQAKKQAEKQAKAAAAAAAATADARKQADKQKQASELEEDQSRGRAPSASPHEEKEESPTAVSPAVAADAQSHDHPKTSPQQRSVAKPHFAALSGDAKREKKAKVEDDDQGPAEATNLLLQASASVGAQPLTDEMLAHFKALSENKEDFAVFLRCLKPSQQQEVLFICEIDQLLEHLAALDALNVVNQALKVASVYLHEDSPMYVRAIDNKLRSQILAEVARIEAEQPSTAPRRFDPLQPVRKASASIGNAASVHAESSGEQQQPEEKRQPAADADIPTDGAAVDSESDQSKTSSVSAGVVDGDKVQGNNNSSGEEDGNEGDAADGKEKDEDSAASENLKVALVALGELLSTARSQVHLSIAGLINHFLDVRAGRVTDEAFEPVVEYDLDMVLEQQRVFRCFYLFLLKDRRARLLLFWSALERLRPHVKAVLGLRSKTHSVTSSLPPSPRGHDAKRPEVEVGEGKLAPATAEENEPASLLPAELRVNSNSNSSSAVPASLPNSPLLRTKPAAVPLAGNQSDAALVAASLYLRLEHVHRRFVSLQPPESALALTDTSDASHPFTAAVWTARVRDLWRKLRPTHTQTAKALRFQCWPQFRKSPQFATLRLAEREARERVNATASGRLMRSKPLISVLKSQAELSRKILFTCQAEHQALIRLRNNARMCGLADDPNRILEYVLVFRHPASRNAQCELAHALENLMQPFFRYPTRDRRNCPLPPHVIQMCFPDSDLPAVLAEASLSETGTSVSGQTAACKHALGEYKSQEKPEARWWLAWKGGQSDDRPANVGGGVGPCRLCSSTCAETLSTPELEVKGDRNNDQSPHSSPSSDATTVASPARARSNTARATVARATAAQQSAHELKRLQRQRLFNFVLTQTSGAKLYGACLQMYAQTICRVDVPAPPAEKKGRGDSENKPAGREAEEAKAVDAEKAQEDQSLADFLTTPDPVAEKKKRSSSGVAEKKDAGPGEKGDADDRKKENALISVCLLSSLPLVKFLQDGLSALAHGVRQKHASATSPSSPPSSSSSAACTCSTSTFSVPPLWDVMRNVHFARLLALCRPYLGSDGSTVPDSKAASASEKEKKTARRSSVVEALDAALGDRRDSESPSLLPSPSPSSPAAAAEDRKLKTSPAVTPARTSRVGQPLDIFACGSSPLLAPVMDFSLAPLFASLSPHRVVLTVEALLTERQVLVVSRRHSLLTLACEAFLSLLYPFSWSYLYVPLLPLASFKFLQCPTPFLIGVHSCFRQQASELIDGDYVLVDLDENAVRFIGSAPAARLPQAYRNRLVSRAEQLFFPALSNLDRPSCRQQQKQKQTSRADRSESTCVFPHARTLCAAVTSGTGAGAGQLEASGSVAAGVASRSSLFRLEFLHMWAFLMHNYRDFCAVLQPEPDSPVSYVSDPSPVLVFDSEAFLDQLADPLAKPFVGALLESGLFPQLLYHRSFAATNSQASCATVHPSLWSHGAAADVDDGLDGLQPVGSDAFDRFEQALTDCPRMLSLSGSFSAGTLRWRRCHDEPARAAVPGIHAWTKRARALTYAQLWSELRLDFKTSFARSSQRPETEFDETPPPPPPKPTVASVRKAAADNAANGGNEASGSASTRTAATGTGATTAVGRKKYSSDMLDVTSDGRRGATPAKKPAKGKGKKKSLFGSAAMLNMKELGLRTLGIGRSDRSSSRASARVTAAAAVAAAAADKKGVEAQQKKQKPHAAKEVAAAVPADAQVPADPQSNTSVPAVASQPAKTY